MNTLTTPMDRAREDLAAARALVEAGFPSQALSRACAAALSAARAALLAVGEVPSTSAGVVAAFSRRVVADDSLEPDHARALRKLFEDRNDVEHALAETPQSEAEDALVSAKLVVTAAVRFIDQRSPRSA